MRLLIILLLVALVCVGIYYATQSGSTTTAETEPEQTEQATEVPQVQEKYGFAPIGE